MMLSSEATRLAISVAANEFDPDFPDLHILPVAKLITHERSDPLRCLSLEEKLITDGILRNPPIVTPLFDDQDHFIVLDGANRTGAFNRMGIQHILAQVVLPLEPALELRTWNQVVIGISPETLLSQIEALPGMEIRSVEEPATNYSGVSEQIEFMRIIFADGKDLSGCVHKSGLFDRIKLLNAIMERLREISRVERTHLQTIDPLREQFPGLAAMILFPGFKYDEIIQLVSAGGKIPAGITRFIISPRALRVNYPLSELRRNLPLEEKEKMFRDWLKMRVLQKGVRTYAERTIMFDE